MAYRIRRRPAVDTETGVRKATLKRTLGYHVDPEKCPTVVYLLDRDLPNAGGFDLALWAEENDLACHPDCGGIANPTSMAALTTLSEWTVVNSVLPTYCHTWKGVGPVQITCIRSFVAGYQEYRAGDGRRAENRRSVTDCSSSAILA
jgi:hypothetical protein